MVLSVNIRGHCTTHRNEFGARRNRQEPAFGNNHFQHLVEGDTTLAFEDPIHSIKRKDLVVLKSRNCVIGKRCIAIAATIATWNKSV